MFSRALGCGARRGPAYTLRLSLGPVRPPWRVLWASKATRAGSFSRDCVPRRRATQDHGNPIIPVFLRSAAAIIPSLQFTSSPLLAATLQQQLHIKLFPFCNGHRQCFFLCVCVCALFPVVLRFTWQERKHDLKSVPTYCMLRRGAGRHKSTLPQNFKSNRAATVHTTTTASSDYLVHSSLTTAVQQQRYNSARA